LVPGRFVSLAEAMSTSEADRLLDGLIHDSAKR
jgi:hypothetical protein